MGAYNAVSEIAWVSLNALARVNLVGREWRLDQRAGRYDIPQSPADGSDRSSPGVWIHAASVGEARAAGALAGSLSKRMPDVRVMLSVLTTAGLDSARKKTPEIGEIVQAPVDLKGPVRRTLSWFDPSLVVFIETEIWPNMIVEPRKRGASTAIVSGKISQRSFERYKLVSPLVEHVLSSVTCVAARTEADKERFCRLGLDPAKVRVTGDVKLDAELPAAPPEVPSWLHGIAGEAHGPLFCAGSTRPGEEEEVARAVLSARRILGEGPVVVIAPRHIERAASVCESLERLGFQTARRSELTPSGWKTGPGPRALVLDTIGELTGVYAGCDVAFVGGTLAPHGGHNVAEPAAVGVPVLFGPHVSNTLIAAERLTESGGGIMVSGSQELSAKLIELLSDSEERRRRGAAAREAIRSLQGAAERTVDFLEESGALGRRPQGDPSSAPR
jgi:3-deoxy-D-manno-octulosonic-acid transferase